MLSGDPRTDLLLTRWRRATSIQDFLIFVNELLFIIISRSISNMKRDDWCDRRVLVTGGAGFLGSNLCLALAAQGAYVTAVDSFMPGSGANVANLAEIPSGQKIHLVEADLRTADLAPLCEGAEIIFNLAAMTSHMLAQTEPETDLAVNAAAQLRLIQAVRQRAPRASIIHASTRQVYGRPTSLPVDESHPINPPDANAISKMTGELYWMLEHTLAERNVVVLRLTNCYGPRQYIRNSLQSFLGSWIGSTLAGRPFEVWGGDQLRDLLFVDDAVAALIAAASPACQGKVFNVGNAPAIRLHELAVLLTRREGRFLMRDMPPGRAGIDIGSFETNDSLFRAATGWAPKMELAAGLAITLEWFRNRLSHYA